MIAKDLRVSERSVERQRRAWRQGGMDALASTGPPKLPKLSEGQFAELEKELALGPAEHGWEDQRWTVARIRASIAWKCGLDCAGMRGSAAINHPSPPQQHTLAPLPSLALRRSAALSPWFTVPSRSKFSPISSPSNGFRGSLMRGWVHSALSTRDTSWIWRPLMRCGYTASIGG